LGEKKGIRRAGKTVKERCDRDSIKVSNHRKTKRKKTGSGSHCQKKTLKVFGLLNLGSIPEPRVR